jgi:hypothetical protein
MGLMKVNGQKANLDQATASDNTVNAVHKVVKVDDGSKADESEDNSDDVARETKGGEPGLGEGAEEVDSKAGSEDLNEVANFGRDV